MPLTTPPSFYTLPDPQVLNHVASLPRLIRPRISLIHVHPYFVLSRPHNLQTLPSHTHTPFISPNKPSQVVLSFPYFYSSLSLSSSSSSRVQDCQLISLSLSSHQHTPITNFSLLSLLLSPHSAFPHSVSVHLLPNTPSTSLTSLSPHVCTSSLTSSSVPIKLYSFPHFLFLSIPPVHLPSSISTYFYLLLPHLPLHTHTHLYCISHPRFSHSFQDLVTQPLILVWPLSLVDACHFILNKRLPSLLQLLKRLTHPINSGSFPLKKDPPALLSTDGEARPAGL